MWQSPSLVTPLSPRLPHRCPTIYTELTQISSELTQKLLKLSPEIKTRPAQSQRDGRWSSIWHLLRHLLLRPHKSRINMFSSVALKAHSLCHQPCFSTEHITVLKEIQIYEITLVDKLVIRCRPTNGIYPGLLSAGRYPALSWQSPINARCWPGSRISHG